MRLGKFMLQHAACCFNIFSCSRYVAIDELWLSATKPIMAARLYSFGSFGLIPPSRASPHSCILHPRTLHVQALYRTHDKHCNDRIGNLYLAFKPRCLRNMREVIAPHPLRNLLDSGLYSMLQFQCWLHSSICCEIVDLRHEQLTLDIG